MALTTAPVELITLDDGVTITVDDNSTTLTLKSTDTDANVGPRMDLTRDSSSPAASDSLGQIRFMGEDAGDNSISYAHMTSFIVDPTDGSEDGKFEIDVRKAGTQRSRLLLDENETVFNNEQQDIDFRVESDSSAYLILADAGDNAVYIGKSDSTQNTAGTAISPTLGVRATVDQNAVGIFNRTTDDGNVLLLRKDGVTVGQMAAKDGDVTVGTGDTGFRFIDGSDAITPHDISNNTGRDNAVSLGTSGARFLNLFMNGGIQFGSRSNKLDDYEEGAWTPVLTAATSAPTVSLTHASGYYIKIGSLVYVRFGMYVGSISGGSGAVRISGLPFAGKTYSSYRQPAALANAQNLTSDPDGPVILYLVDGDTKLEGRLFNNADTALPISHFQAGSWCIANLSYDVS